MATSSTEAVIACQKEHFQLDPQVAYLNCAYMAPLLKTVSAAGEGILHKQASPNRFGRDDFFEPVQNLREKFARLISCEDPLRIALMPSVSYGISTVCANIHPSPDQEILLVDEQFPSNVYPWTRLAETSGASLRFVSTRDVNHRGQSWNTAILEAIGPQTAAVSMAIVHWADGTLFDAKAIGKRCREVGAAFIIDGTQSVGALPFSVAEVQPDALICAGYKWLLGAYGMTLAYLGPAFDNGRPIEENWMHRAGSDRFEELVNYQPEYRPKAQRYNMGECSSFLQVAMLNRSLDQILSWTPEAISSYAERLTSLVDEALVPLGFQMEDEAYRAPHLFGIRLPGDLNPVEVSNRLREAGVVVSVRGESVRVSCHVWNTQEDLFRLHEVLKGFVR